jgi:hypothetical protein
MAMVEVELWKQLMLAIDRGNEEAVKEVLAAADAVSCYSHLIGRTTKVIVDLSPVFPCAL